MGIKGKIMHYITCYDGSEKRIIDNILNDIGYTKKTKSAVERSIRNCIWWLIDNNYIKIVPYNELNEFEKRYYESDGYCTIYRIINYYHDDD